MSLFSRFHNPPFHNPPFLNQTFRYSTFSIQYSIFLFHILLSFSLLAQQQWTEPLNITNLGGYSKDPDMVIDHNGVIHVAWSYCITQTHWLIMYTRSEDNGLTWAEPLDLLQNTDLWMSQPHIACDSKNDIYVTYTYNGLQWPPTGRVIKMLTYDGHQWSEPIIISEGMPGSHYPKVLVSNDDIVYVFWGYLSDEMYYRYRQNNLWSDIYCPYCDSIDLFYFSDGLTVSNHLIHLAGSSISVNYYGERPQYYEYSFVTNTWYNPEQISSDTIVVDIDISLNKSSNPESVYRTYPSPDDETMHTKKEGNFWSTPDLVSVTDKRKVGQQIAINQNNEVHVVETEYYVSSVLETQLVHYFKMGNSWMSQPIDSSDNMCHFPKLLFKNNRLYVVYWWHSEALGTGDLRFSKYDLVTNIDEKIHHDTKFNIYPNPSKGIINIVFENNKQQHINLSVFNINGKLIKMIANKIFPPSKQRLLWNGTNKNGKEVNSGPYLVRLKSGRKTVTQTVEIIK
nr:T9SS type A sorting domain-containing protein [Bacteroidota bacterium]